MAHPIGIPTTASSTARRAFHVGKAAPESNGGSKGSPGPQTPKRHSWKFYVICLLWQALLLGVLGTLALKGRHEMNETSTPTSESSVRGEAFPEGSNRAQ